MDFKVPFLCLLVLIYRVQCQECRAVSICSNELQGPPGEKGSQGAEGPPGIEGATGIQGPPGEKGSQGVEGPPGIEGAAGIQGPPGEKGSQGVEGPPGVEGATGIQGPSGERGSQGVEGPPGIDGTAGIQGPPGEKGSQGVKGPLGNEGAAGIQGPPGEKGSQGVKGPPGIDGATGIQGPPGKKGSQGIKGESGSTADIEAFQQEIRHLITDFNHSVSLLESKLNAAKEEIDFLSRPAHCTQSSEDGVQFLPSGEGIYCRQQWRVIQRRFNGQVRFYNRTWNEYKNGFGSLSTEFWIGLDMIHRLTRNGGCRLRVELGASGGGTAFAEYREFSVRNESELFRLNIAGYNVGTAGDSLTNKEFSNGNVNNKPFSTSDRDNDRWIGLNCAADGRGGWWHQSCGLATLNGRWGESNRCWGFNWYSWKSCKNLVLSTMMIRCN